MAIHEHMPTVSECVPSVPPALRGQIVAGARTLGVLGGAAGTAPRIMAALCDPDIDVRRLTDLLGKEPVLCARVLRVANSPIYAQRQSVKSLDRALVVLGMDSVRGIAAAACLARTAMRSENSHFDLRMLISHSQATAAAADSLARHAFPDLISEAFLVGLLHDLGTLVQLQIDPAGFAAVVARRRAGDDRSLAALEAELAAVTHEECGAVLFEEWRLPQSLVTATRFHHHPLSAPATSQRLTGLINVASTIARTCIGDPTLANAAAGIDSQGLECLELDEQQLREAFDATGARMISLLKVLDNG